MKRSLEQILEREHLVIRTKWEAYKVLRAGGKYSLESREVYKSVRKRLKTMLKTLGKPELIDNFLYIDESDRK